MFLTPRAACRTAEDTLFRASPFGASMLDRGRAAQKNSQRRRSPFRGTRRSRNHYPRENLCPLLVVVHLSVETGTETACALGAQGRYVGSPSAQFTCDFLVCCPARTSVQGSQDLSQNRGKQIQMASSAAGRGKGRSGCGVDPDMDSPRPIQCISLSSSKDVPGEPIREPTTSLCHARASS